jgi:WD40 repeat protein/energy-coupling factor transporter ATP-binding protein EcfA2
MAATSNTNNSNSLFNPFPGLRPFKVEESHLFFGREGQSEDILSKLSDNQFVAVIGASGSGKSSLIYCGLVPTLYGGFIGESKSKWNIIASRPGNSPIDNLATAILEKKQESGEKDIQIKQKIDSSILRSSSNGLVELLDQSFNFEEENVLVIIDQFEELFRYKSSKDDQSTYNESEAFVKLLVTANKTSDVPVYVVLTMRSDFIGECSQFHELTELINDSNYLVPQMTRDDFKMAIEGPVAVGGAKIETQLLQQLLNEVGDNPDQLPILQHALMRTWDYWMEHSDREKPINISDYEAIGRMEMALSEHANEAFDELKEEEKWICESMFKTLTEKGNDNRGIRHPTSIKDLASISKSAVEDVIKVINPFRAAGRSFISPASDIEINGDSIIDLSHESLMRIWNKLKVWVEEEWDAVQMYMRLSEASELYQLGKTGLWRPPDLQLALNWNEKQKPTLAWAKRYNPAFERTIVYLETSDKEYKAEEDNKIKLQKRQLRRSKIFAIVLGTAAIIAMGLTIYSQTLRAQALKQERIANERKVEADKQREIAQEQTVIAKEQEQEAVVQKGIAEEQTVIAIEKEKEATQNFTRAEQQTKLAVRREKEANQQRSLAEKNAEEARKQTIEAESQRQLAYRRRMLSISQSMAVKSQQISDNTQLKALVAYQAYLFNENFEGDKHNPDVYLGLYYALKGLKGQYYNALNGHEGSVKDIAFIPETNTMYSTGGDGKILKWDINDLLVPADTIVKDEFGHRAMEITPDSKWLIYGTDEGKINLLNLSNSVETDQELPGHAKDPEDPESVSPIISGLAIAPNNKYFISSGLDKKIFKWDLRTLESEVVIECESKINSINISPDSKYIIIGLQDGNVQIVDAESKSLIKLIENDERSAITAASWNRKGSWIVIGDSKGNLIVRDAVSYEELDNLEGHKSPITDINFNPLDDIMATSSRDGTARMWDCTNLNNQPIILQDHDKWVLSVVFSPDGKSLVTSSNQKDRLLIWSTKSEILANDLKARINRNMTDIEWDTYVATDVSYEKTFSEIDN